MSATMIPSEWLEPGAVLPVTAETVATLLAAVKASTFTQGRAAGLEEIIDMLDKFGTLKYRAGCSTIKTGQELLEQAHAYRHMIHEALDALSHTTSDAGKDDDKWYLQDTRSYVGNDVLWWAKDGKGYTTDVSKAHVYERDAAFRQAAMRGTDRAWPKAYIDRKTRPAVDMQYINHQEAMAAIAAIDAAIAAQGEGNHE